MAYRCSRCARSFADDYSVWRCSCGGPLWWDAEPRLTRRDVGTGESSMWRYAAALPLGLGQRTITLGEGLTPLLDIEWDGHQVWVKDETRQPSGSFKDRGVAMIVNHAKIRAVPRLTEDSSGNAGASFAAYCAAADIICDLFVPTSASAGKLAQAIAHGARLHRVDGPREASATAAQTSRAGRYAGHNWHPLFVEGVATIGYELWEQAGHSAPDRVVVPVGNGSLVLGLSRAFRTLLASGEVDRLPRIIAVQSQASQAIYRRLHRLDATAEQEHTIAEGIAIRATTHDPEVVAALRACAGDCLVVSDDEVVAALRQALGRGMFIEPTAAVGLAGLSRLLESSAGSAGRTVVVLTGHGLKAADLVAGLVTGAGR